MTLTGSGGCGKTAARVGIGGTARRPVPRRTRVDRAGIVFRSRGVLAAVASGLGVDEAPGGVTLNHIVTRLLGRDAVLLVLDNAEHVLASAAAVVDAVTKGLDTVTVVCTSRETLSVPARSCGACRRCAPRRSNATDELDSADVEQFDAVLLFADRARRARRGFAITDGNATAVAQICSRLDGMPLAIELAAARMRSMPPERIAAQLDDRFRLLAGGPRTLLARQQTLQASVDWSGDLLDDVERAAFRRLGVFVGGFTVDAAEAVIGDFGDIDPYDVAELVGRLVDKSLVQFDPAPRPVLAARNDPLLRAATVAGCRRDRPRLARRRPNGVRAWLTWANRNDEATDVNGWWDSRLDIVGRVDPEWPNCVNALEWAIPGTPLVPATRHRTRRLLGTAPARRRLGALRDAGSRARRPAPARVDGRGRLAADGQDERCRCRVREVARRRHPVGHRARRRALAAAARSREAHRHGDVVRPARRPAGRGRRGVCRRRPAGRVVHGLERIAEPGGEPVRRRPDASNPTVVCRRSRARGRC